MKYLLDTCIISEFAARHPNQNVIQWIRVIDSYAVFISVVTIGEIHQGIVKLPESRRKNDLRTWLDSDLLARFSGRVLPLNVPLMLTWGKLIGSLEASGKKMPAFDSLIAATALHHQCKLVTRNYEDF